MTEQRNKNEQIESANVKLIDIDGKMLGEFETNEAIQLAYSKDMDLVQMNDDIVPICKIMNLEKVDYAKKKQLRHKKNVVTKLKEVRVKILTSDHDLLTKATQISKFLVQKHRVRVAVSVAGSRRTQSDWELAKNTAQKLLSMLSEPYKTEGNGSSKGNFYTLDISAAK